MPLMIEKQACCSLVPPLAIVISITLSGCAHTTHFTSATTTKKPLIQQAKAEQSQAAPLDSATQAEIATPPSPFLKDLSDKDIALVKKEARRTLASIWAYVDARAQKVRHRMLHALDDIGAPHELSYIPVAESGYNPYALSHAGAFGLWQLMPKTAASLGAKSKHGVDARRHVEASTKAAANYLLSLYQRFNNWALAIAAYNLGPWGVQKRLNKTPWTPEMGINALPFPAETKHYVKQVLGMIALHHDGELSFSTPIQTEEVRLAAPVDLNQIEKVSGLPKHEIFRLNPEFDYQQYIQHDISVHLPPTHAARLKAALAQTPNMFKPKYISVRIRKGDSLWKLAKKHHTSVAYLKKLNPKLHGVLSIGKTITVPASGSLTVASSKPNPLLSKGRRIRYKVRAGDSLWKIAKKFGTSTRAIARANQLSPNQLIRPGDRLWIIATYRPS